MIKRVRNFTCTLHAGAQEKQPATTKGSKWDVSMGLSLVQVVRSGHVMTVLKSLVLAGDSASGWGRTNSATSLSVKEMVTGWETARHSLVRRENGAMPGKLKGWMSSNKENVNDLQAGCRSGSRVFDGSSRTRKACSASHQLPHLIYSIGFAHSGTPVLTYRLRTAYACAYVIKTRVGRGR